MFAGNFAPMNFGFCDGSLLPISQNDALFTLLGTTYGGDGQNTFALPDLRGRLPIHQANTHPVGSLGGSETVTLTVNQLPVHTHSMACTVGAASAVTTPAGNVPLDWSDYQFSSQAANTTLNSGTITPTGGSQPHNNMPPVVVINYLIALYGIFPSQS